MRAADTRQETPKRATDVQQTVHAAAASQDATRTKRVLTHYVDPYDMSTDPPPPDEPGYGHGV